VKIPSKLFSGRIVQKYPEAFLSGTELILKSTTNEGFLIHRCPKTQATVTYERSDYFPLFYRRLHSKKL